MIKIFNECRFIFKEIRIFFSHFFLIRNVQLIILKDEKIKKLFTSYFCHFYSSLKPRFVTMTFYIIFFFFYPEKKKRIKRKNSRT